MNNHDLKTESCTCSISSVCIGLHICTLPESTTKHKANHELNLSKAYNNSILWFVSQQKKLQGIQTTLKWLCDHIVTVSFSSLLSAVQACSLHTLDRCEGGLPTFQSFHCHNFKGGVCPHLSQLSLVNNAKLACEWTETVKQVTSFMHTLNTWAHTITAAHN